jgi:hypothetical protein
MLLSKYTNQSTGSNSNRSSPMKRPRSPPRERYSRHMRPYGQWAPEPWMAPPPYVPYYFNGGWMQPPMTPYVFHPGWAVPRKSIHDRITRPVRDRLNYNVNWSPQKYLKGDKKEWRPKSPIDETLEASKQ